MWTHALLFYAVGYNLLLFISVLRFSPFVSWGPIQAGFSVLLMCLIIPLEYFLLWGHKKIFWAHLLLSLFQPWNQPFIQRPWFL